MLVKSRRGNIRLEFFTKLVFHKYECDYNIFSGIRDLISHYQLH